MPRILSLDLPLSRRDALTSAAAVAATFTFWPSIVRGDESATTKLSEGELTMGFVTTDDGVQIFYKDWGPKDARPIVFHHGWPLSSDDWDAQMLFFLSKGYRVVAHDRRGHGRSEQVAEGHDIDHYAADAFAVAKALDLRNAVHVGHSTGGGEVARYVARHGEPAGRVTKAVLVAAIPPLMLKTTATPRAHRSRSLTASVQRWPATVPNSSETFPPVRSMGSIARVRRSMKA